MQNQRLEIRAQRRPFLNDCIEILLAHIVFIEGHRKVSLGTTIEMHPLDESGVFMPQPTLTLRPDEAQQFMDELWRTGIRPTEGAGSVGQMAATEKHLEDMRRLVFAPATATPI